MSKTDITKVALFCTASAPFSRQWIKEVRKQAVDSAICTTTGLPGDHFRLVPIPGKFRGYTPLQLARRYVVPVLGREESPFASQSFVVADDKTHEDGKLLVVAIDWTTSRGVHHSRSRNFAYRTQHGYRHSSDLP